MNGCPRGFLRLEPPYNPSKAPFLSLKLHLERLPQFVRYLLVGGSNTVIGYAIIFFCMYGLGWGAFTSNAMGYGLCLILSYWMNRTFTFRSHGKKIPELAKFLVVFAIAYAFNLAALGLLISWGLHEGLSQILAGVFYVVSAFLANKLIVFKNVSKTDTPN